MQWHIDNREVTIDRKLKSYIDGDSVIVLFIYTFIHFLVSTWNAILWIFFSLEFVFIFLFYFISLKFRLSIYLFTWGYLPLIYLIYVVSDVVEAPWDGRWREVEWVEQVEGNGSSSSNNSSNNHGSYLRPTHPRHLEPPTTSRTTPPPPQPRNITHHTQIMVGASQPPPPRPFPLKNMGGRTPNKGGRRAHTHTPPRHPPTPPHLCITS